MTDNNPAAAEPCAKAPPPSLATRCGRFVFGASAVFFALLAFRWHDAATWQTLVEILRLPFGLVLGNGLMLALLAAGFGIQFRRTVRPAAVLLCVVFACFSLACTPDIFATPAVFAPYDSFFEQISLLSGALALFAATQPFVARASALFHCARIGIGLSTVSFTIMQILFFRATVSDVPRWIPPGQTFWAVLTTIAFALAAIAILLNRRARLALRMMTLMVALFGLLVWIPSLIVHPESHLSWSECALTFLIMGAAWMVADSPFASQPRAETAKAAHPARPSTH